MTNLSRPVATAKIWRNLTSSSMKSVHNGKVSVYHAIFDSKELLEFSGDLNVRREKGGNVKKAILNTLEDAPNNFRYLNGGITIVTKVLTTRDASDGVEISFHRDASIINGTQTQGALRTYHGWNGSECTTDAESVEVDVTIIESLDDDLITDISVARNVQNTVKDVSVYGRQGAFDSLNESLRKQKSPIQLATSETDKDHFETGKALQLLFAIIPDDFWADNIQIKRNRPSLYSSKAKWLKYYGGEATDPTDIDKFNNLEAFALDMIEPLLSTYIEVRQSPLWLMKYWRTEGVKVDKDGGVRVVDGFMIPFISALSVFVKYDGKKWGLDYPKSYNIETLISKIKKLTHGAGDDANPQTFGKKDESYEILEMTAQMIKMK